MTRSGAPWRRTTRRHRCPTAPRPRAAPSREPMRAVASAATTTASPRIGWIGVSQRYRTSRSMANAERGGGQRRRPRRSPPPDRQAASRAAPGRDPPGDHHDLVDAAIDQPGSDRRAAPRPRSGESTTPRADPTATIPTERPNAWSTRANGPARNLGVRRRSTAALPPHQGRHRSEPRRNPPTLRTAEETAGAVIGHRRGPTSVGGSAAAEHADEEADGVGDGQHRAADDERRHRHRLGSRSARDRPRWPPPWP